MDTHDFIRDFCAQAPPPPDWACVDMDEPGKALLKGSGLGVALGIQLAEQLG